jgi:hypothetical protein
MTSEEKNAVSHRYLALDKLRKCLLLPETEVSLGLISSLVPRLSDFRASPRVLEYADISANLILRIGLQWCILQVQQSIEAKVRCSDQLRGMSLIF